MLESDWVARIPTESWDEVAINRDLLGDGTFGWRLVGGDGLIPEPHGMFCAEVEPLDNFSIEETALDTPVEEKDKQKGKLVIRYSIRYCVMKLYSLTQLTST